MYKRKKKCQLLSHLCQLKISSTCQRRKQNPDETPFFGRAAKFNAQFQTKLRKEKHMDVGEPANKVCIPTHLLNELVLKIDETTIRYCKKKKRSNNE